MPPRRAEIRLFLSLALARFNNNKRYTTMDKKSKNKFKNVDQVNYYDNYDTTNVSKFLSKGKTFAQKIFKVTISITIISSLISLLLSYFS